MNGRLKPGLVLALLLVLFAAMPALAQEPAAGCSTGKSTDPELLFNTDKSDNFNYSVFTLIGCRFQPGESVIVEPVFKLGEKLVPLDSKTATVNADGGFEVTFTYDGEPEDFQNGYSFEATATAEGGDTARTGYAAIPRGGMPPEQLPPSGAGGTANGSSFPFVPVALTSLVLLAMAAVTLRGTRAASR